MHRGLLQVTVLTDHDVVQRLLLTSMGPHRAAPRGFRASTFMPRPCGLHTHTAWYPGDLGTSK